MNLADVLNRIIEDGIKASKADYCKPDQKNKLDGSIRGFEDCRNKTPVEIVELFYEAQRRAQLAYFSDSPEGYWFWRCRASEIEWVANVLSAVLVNEGLPPVISIFPTARGMMKAAEIVGVSPSQAEG